MRRWNEFQEENCAAMMAARETEDELAAISCEYHMEED